MLPCACEHAGLQIQGYHVPLKSIYMFWRKLHVNEHEVIEEESETQFDLDKEYEE